MNISDVRRKNIEKARASSNTTNRLKGLRTFVRSRTKKSSIKNDIIDDLIRTKYYEYIYNIWLNSDDIGDDEFYNKYLNGKYNDNDIEGLSVKDFDLLCTFDFVPPDELKNKYEGLYIYELPIDTFK